MNGTGTILLVEDDKNIQRIDRRILEREGFLVLCAGTLVKTRGLLRTHMPDVLVLDVMLPDGSGLAFCEKIRSTTSAPVLFLTVRDEKSVVIEGLVAGGNGYITKSYDVDEFVARVKVQLRFARITRKGVEQAKTWEHGPLVLDTVALRAFLSGQDMLLTTREFSVLLYLLKHEGRILPAAEIYEEIWKQPMSGNVSAFWKCISRLKDKLVVSEGRAPLMNFRSEGYLLEIVEDKQKKQKNIWTAET